MEGGVKQGEGGRVRERERGGGRGERLSYIFPPLHSY